MEKDENTEEKTAVYCITKRIKNDGWRDVRLGFVQPLNRKIKTFVGGMVSYPVVDGQLLLAEKLPGLKSETEPISVADGGNGLFEEFKRQFPKMRFILDMPHLKDPFYDTSEQLVIPAKGGPAWVNPRVETISEGNVSTVMEELAILFAENGNKRLGRLLGYLERFRECLDYDDCQNRGYPIGSGEIESAHKYVPQKRLKIPRTSWFGSINPIPVLESNPLKLCPLSPTMKEEPCLSASTTTGKSRALVWGLKESSNGSIRSKAQLRPPLYPTSIFFPPKQNRCRPVNAFISC